MLTIPFITLLTQELYEEYVFWLHHKGGDDENTTDDFVFSFLTEVEQGSYEVAVALRPEADRLYLEFSRNRRLVKPDFVAPARAGC